MVSTAPATPRHVAIVMDGNGRWATQRHLPRFAGHKRGVESLRACVKRCAELGIEVLTVFAFSSENWSRPVDEVSFLMELLVRALERETAEFQRAGIRIRFVGDRTGLSAQVCEGIEAAERLTADNRVLVLNVCFNYGGRWDILQAARRLVAAQAVVSEESFSAALALSHVPDPDLVIRTGGEMRISNFLLWQAAYAELFFTEKLWPDFDVAEFDQALLAYSRRERRFGKTSVQVNSPPLATT